MEQETVTGSEVVDGFERAAAIRHSFEFIGERLLKLEHFPRVREKRNTNPLSRGFLTTATCARAGRCRQWGFHPDISGKSCSLAGGSPSTLTWSTSTSCPNRQGERLWKHGRRVLERDGSWPHSREIPCPRVIGGSLLGLPPS